MITPRDFAYLDMAFGLAAKALGCTCPNPQVGAVIVRGGAIVGFGHHQAAGSAHAEAVALERAGLRARRATLYVTLEPCVHWGRTPPCVEAVVASGIARVVVAALDPNPAVYARGVRRLRRAGIEVEVGARGGRDRRFNEGYEKWIATRRPFVTVKAALSLDGKMATKTSEAAWISSRETRAYMHLVRAEHDAVLVGAETALRDDPRLTVRPPSGPGRKILRVVLDPELRLPPEARIFRTPDGGPVLLAANERAGRARRKTLAARGADIEIFPGRSPRLDLGQVLDRLGARPVASVLVEGGGAIAASFLDERLADKVLVSLSPLLIGGERAVAFYAGRGTARLRDALRLSRLSTVRLGGDLLVEGYV